MSFSGEVKNELAHLLPGKACCARAEAAGLFRAAGSIRRVGGARGGLAGLRMETGNPAVARHIKQLFAQLADFPLQTAVDDTKGARGGLFRKRYILSAPASNRATALLEEIGILDLSDGIVAWNGRTPPALLESKCCRKAYLRGLFLGAGHVVDPERGYHLEFALEDPFLAADTRRVLNSFRDIHARVTRRRGKPVVYLKSSEQIKDMLGILGADRHLLAYEDVRMIREMKETANRISNCDNANVDRALRAGESQVDFITALLRGGGGFPETLPPKLREAAEARLSNPEASLTEIGAMLRPPVTKSAVAARFARLERIAGGNA